MSPTNFGKHSHDHQDSKKVFFPNKITNNKFSTHDNFLSILANPTARVYIRKTNETRSLPFSSLQVLIKCKCKEAEFIYAADQNLLSPTPTSTPTGLMIGC